MSPAEVCVNPAAQLPEGYAARVAAAMAFSTALTQLRESAAALQVLDRKGDPVKVAAGLVQLRRDLDALNEAHRAGLALGADRRQHYTDFVAAVEARLAQE